ncbi:transposase [Colletotrichum chrysophilum]|uniref:Transposase n=1 Tax=Colletotrichum chrysophilum TaxID=1836956 RepID=A0AAD9AR03_9PEZI|nr:transposase [Colletotrichum chrysophilum]
MIRPGMVVTRSDRIGKPKNIQPGNREWATAICCVGGDGYAMPPFLVVQGRFHLASWYSEAQIPDTWVVKTTSNGCTNNETGLEWLQHFDKHTKLRLKGVYRMLVVDGYESHVSSDFEEYCKENKIITLCLPSHSLHLTQPLDVGCYSALKLRYGSQIEHFIKARITHITKPEFFLAFKAAFFQTFSPENVFGGFRGAGLIPYDPQAVLLKLDVQLRTPTAPNTPDKGKNIQVSGKLALYSEFLYKSILTPIYDAVDKLSKGLQSVSHLTALLQEEVQYLRDTNTALSKRRRAKRTRLQDSGALDGSQAREIMTEKGIIEEEGCEEEKNEGSSKRRRTSLRHCGICRKTGHNARTCPETEEISNLSDSE